MLPRITKYTCSNFIHSGSCEEDNGEGFVHLGRRGTHSWANAFRQGQGENCCFLQVCFCFNIFIGRQTSWRLRKGRRCPATSVELSLERSPTLSCTCWCTRGRGGGWKREERRRKLKPCSAFHLHCIIQRFCIENTYTLKMLQEFTTFLWAKIQQAEMFQSCCKEGKDGNEQSARQRPPPTRGQQGPLCAQPTLQDHCRRDVSFLFITVG